MNRGTRMALALIALMLACAPAWAHSISVEGEKITYVAQLRFDPQLRETLVPCSSGLCQETYCVAVMALTPPHADEWLILTGKMVEAACVGQAAGSCLMVAGSQYGPTIDFSGQPVSALIATSAATMKPIACQ